MPIIQVDALDRQVIDFIIAEKANRFDLDNVTRVYKVYCEDLLSLCEPRFKLWLASYFKEEKMDGLAAMIEHTYDSVLAIQVWDDLKKMLDAESFLQMEEKAARFGGPYLPLATYIRHQLPKGPFCLPLHEWFDERKRIAIEDFVCERFGRVDFGLLMRYVSRLYRIPRNI